MNFFKKSISYKTAKITTIDILFEQARKAKISTMPELEEYAKKHNIDLEQYFEKRPDSLRHFEIRFRRLKKESEDKER